MKIIEKNKVIAQFMGANMIVENYHGINIIEFPNKKTFDLNGLIYHCDWNWLMEVVEKIENTHPINVIISCSSCEIYNCDTGETMFFFESIKKDAVYNACFEFILWHNQQLTK